MITVFLLAIPVNKQYSEYDTESYIIRKLGDYYKMVDIFKILLDKSPIDYLTIRNKSGYNAFEFLVSNGYRELSDMIFDKISQAEHGNGKN